MRRYPAVLAAILLVTACRGYALDGVPQSEYHDRRVHLAAKLSGGVALIFAADAPSQTYQSWRQDEDFYYLTGWNQPGAALLVESITEPPTGMAAEIAQRTLAAGAPEAVTQGYREVLFLPDRDYLLDVYTGPMPDARTSGIRRLSGVDEVRPMSDLTVELVRLSRDLNALFHVSLPTDQPKAKAAIELLNASDGFHISTPPTSDLRPLVHELRAIKSPAEIELLQKAANASVIAQEAMMRATHDGQRERSLSGLIDYALKEGGCERPSYPSVVAAGLHSTILHYEEDAGTLHAGDVMLVDAAGEYSMYASDITRTVPVGGHFTARQRELYDVVLGAQQAAIDSFVSGKSNLKRRSAHDPNSLDLVAWEYINTHGKDLHGEPLGKYFLSPLGHAVGIDVHDPVDTSKPFVPGSVFTIEPGIYIAEEKIGIRVEDTFYVNPDGKLVSLSRNLPKRAEDVEAIMQRGLHEASH